MMFITCIVGRFKLGQHKIICIYLYCRPFKILKHRRFRERRGAFSERTETGWIPYHIKNHSGQVRGKAAIFPSFFLVVKNAHV